MITNFLDGKEIDSFFIEEKNININDFNKKYYL